MGSIGVLLMARSGAPPSQLGVQIGALVLGALLAPAIAALGRDRLAASAPWIAGIGLALLAGACLGEGLLGVHRWITLGPIRIHASSLASPAILIASAALLSRDRWPWACALLAAAELAHVVQPDAGQATALAAGGIAALAAARGPSPLVRAPFALALAASAALAFTRPDPLPAVPIVEGIVHLAGEFGRAFQALSILALAWLPLAIAIVARRAPPDDAMARTTAMALTAYLAGAIVAPIAGNFPVPVMGFGASPILGAAICLGAAAATASSRRTPGSPRSRYTDSPR